MDHARRGGGRAPHAGGQGRARAGGRCHTRGRCRAVGGGRARAEGGRAAGGGRARGGQGCARAGRQGRAGGCRASGRGRAEAAPRVGRGAHGLPAAAPCSPPSRWAAAPRVDRGGRPRPPAVRPLNGRGGGAVRWSRRPRHNEGGGGGATRWLAAAVVASRSTGGPRPPTRRSPHRLSPSSACEVAAGRAITISARALALRRRGQGRWGPALPADHGDSAPPPVSRSLGGCWPPADRRSRPSSAGSW